MNQQDEQFDQVLNTVQNLKGVAQTMGNELEVQAGYLRELDQNIDTTKGKMGVALRKMNVVIRNTGI